MRYRQKVVMPGLDPGIHATAPPPSGSVDCRVKPGNDEKRAVFELDLR
jgi:hypothetical protein